MLRRTQNQLLQPVNRIVAFSLILALGCSSSSTAEGTKYSVKWYDSFDLFSYIANEKQAATIEDVRRQLTSVWEDSVEVESKDGRRKRTVRDCGEFFQARQDGLEPWTNVMQLPYNHLGLMCTAARVIVDGKPAKESYVRDIKVDVNIATHLPAEVAYRPKAENGILTGERWAEVQKITGSIERDKEVELHSEGAIHFVRKVASGDFNGDGLEDLLLDIVHAAKEGTHATESLYLMTKLQKSGSLKILERYSVLKPQ